MVARNVALVAGIALLVVVSGLAGATAGEPTQQNASDLDTHPDDGNYEVEVSPEGPGETHVSISYSYQPRSPSERQRARNETLQTEWFRGQDILDGAISFDNRSTNDFEDIYTSLNYIEEDRIIVARSLNWPGFMQDRDRVVIGPGFASHLDDGDELDVQLDTYDWANWSTPDEDAGSAGESGITFTWTIGEDSEPRLVLNRSDYKSHEGDELGPVPFVLPILAVALLLAACSRR